MKIDSIFRTAFHHLQNPVSKTQRRADKRCCRAYGCREPSFFMYVFVASVQRRLMTAIFHLWWFPWAEPFGRAKELWKFRLKLLWSHSLLDSILLNVPPKNDRGCPQQHDFCLLDNWIWRRLAIKLIPARNDASKSIQKLCAKSQRYHTHTHKMNISRIRKWKATQNIDRNNDPTRTIFLVSESLETHPIESPQVASLQVRSCCCCCLFCCFCFCKCFFSITCSFHVH